MENIRIIFVLPQKYTQDSEASQIMLEAFEQCKQNVCTSVTWVKERDLNEIVLNKTDFVVFQEFEGEYFEKVKETKCARILGPLAVSICLMEGKPIPNFPWPIYNVAMYGCIITCSHLSKIVKSEIKTKVEQMGGCYVDTLLAENTHLITGSAKSEKYLMAAEAGVKLMCPSWVEEVWQISQSLNIHATDERFNKHVCLPFQNLVICLTGVSSETERKNIEKLVNDNGGCYSAKLSLTNTDILLCSENNSTEKYKAARQQKNIKCVSLSWMTDSIQKGYALSHLKYQINTKMTSTPTKSDQLVNPEFSMLSVIGVPDRFQRSTVEDTLANAWSPVHLKTNCKRKATVPDYEAMIEALDVKKAKRAGQYLDGCSVYITGFGLEHTEKLNKIINLSGATRYDNLSDRVTHVIVGDPNCHEVKLIRNKGMSCGMVTLQWLLDSIENGQPVPEDKYLLTSSDLDKTSTTSSPLSKKGLSLLRSAQTVTEKEFKANLSNVQQFEDQPENDIVQQYLRQATSSQEDTLAKLLRGGDNSTISKQIPVASKSDFTIRSHKQTIHTQDSSISITQDATSELPSQYFEHLKFLVVGFEEEEHAAIKEKIESFSGELVSKNFKGIPDFLVLPIFIDQEVHLTATEIVNNLFLYECEQEEVLIKSIEYYHRPYTLPENKPLQNCVITVSSYRGFERFFLRNLIDALGGVPQEQFARVTSEITDIVASTHLVSYEATGKKYDAALKWGVPVVSKDWLMNCYKTGKRISEAGFLLGSSKAPDRWNSSILHHSISAKDHVSSSTNEGASKEIGTPTGPGPSRISRVLTPVNHVTPLHKRFLDSAEKPFSQVTPINKIMQNFRESNLLLNTSDPKESKEYTIPQPWMNIKTPETPLGAFLTPNPSPGLRKQWEYWLRQFPDKDSPKSAASTPLSEIKKQLWDKVLRRDQMEQPDFSESPLKGTNENMKTLSNSESSEPKTPENLQLANRLQQLEDMLTASGGGGKRQSTKFQATIPAPSVISEYRDSQPCTVGWDFQNQEPEQIKKKVFSLSGIGDEEARSNMVRQIKQLGGSVSDLSNFDPTCTHLLCVKPARNEKTLSSMAAGKWVLHTSYLEKSIEAGYFLDEEAFEYGNPKAVSNFRAPPDRDTEVRMQRMHWWRKEISKRGYKAFNDMRAIIVAEKREPIVRVVEAGGGTVIDVKPPFEDPVHATHCLLEQKSVEDFSIYLPLARQGVYVVNTVFISDYLDNPKRDIRDCILPFFAKYYARD